MNTNSICREFGKLKGRTIVGLTGAAASGKSAALGRFGELGAFCVSTDALAKEVLTSGACYNRILEKFGPGVLLKDGSINRNKLAEEVFSDESRRNLLESILHPEILKRSISLIRTSHEKIIIVEVPLLFEAGLEKCFALTVCVDAPYGSRLKRAMRRGWSRAEFRRRNLAQFPAKEKAGRADLVVQNDGPLRELRRTVKLLYGFLASTAPRA